MYSIGRSDLAVREMGHKILDNFGDHCRGKFNDLIGDYNPIREYIGNAEMEECTMDKIHGLKLPHQF